MQLRISTAHALQGKAQERIDPSVRALGEALDLFSLDNPVGSVLVSAWEKLSIEDQRKLARQVEDRLRTAGLDAR